MQPQQTVLLLKQTSCQCKRYVSAATQSFIEFRGVLSAERQRNRTVSSFYNQPAIDTAACKASTRLTPATILYSGKSKDGQHVLKSAQYLQRELPIRIAHRITDFRNLPFIVASNPVILGVHELYIRAFSILNSFRPIRTDADEQEYCIKLQELLEDHKVGDVVSKLAQGFRECRRHLADQEVAAKFLDVTLTSRLSIRMLAQHHLALRDDKPNHVGIIHMAMQLKELIERNSKFVTRMAAHKYGRAPTIKMSGHVDATFPYIELPLEYILPELLKNAVRATIENHPDDEESYLPPIHITIASNEVDFVIRISDRGKGIPHHLMRRVLEYNFTTASSSCMSEESASDNGDDGVSTFSDMMEAVNPSPVGGPMHGYDNLLQCRG
ncbi:Histidine kinase-like ATPase C-terminal domain [Trinorchestia longiramus]|nr:Histidine kinase-like ATPase C-terminal domain [Trinorchestia longiramus]